MKPMYAAMFVTATLTLSPAVTHVTRAQTTVTPDPKTTYGWVFLQNGTPSSTRVSVPSDALGRLDDASLPNRANGFDLSGVVRIAKIESDSPIDVKLRQATLVFRGGQSPRVRNESRPRYNIALELEFSVRQGASVPSGKQMPVRITLEHVRNGSQLPFYVVAQAR